MAEYTAREWSNGDIVTASNLNQIENGVEAVAEESEFLIVNETYANNTYSFDKTWQQIYDAFPLVYIMFNLDDTLYKYSVSEVFYDGFNYIVSSHNYQYVAASTNAYPSMNNLA